MESTETGSIDDSLDSKNLEASVEDVVVAKYDDCNSQVLSSQTEEDQSGEQIYGYLEVQNPGGEDATIYLDPQNFNLTGQRLILAQNDEGNEIFVVVSQEPDGQPLEQTFAHASILHTDEVNFEDGLKEHGALVVDEHSQSLEFVETEEVSQENDERHVMENSGGVINIASENQCSVNTINIESPLWSASNNAHLKNDGSEMLFIPNPTVVLAPEETRHKKLMQLACIAHELHTADNKINTTVLSDSLKDAESPLREFENSVIVQNAVEKNSKGTLAFSSESTKSLLSNESENEDVDFNPKPAKSVDVSSLLSCTSTRPIDNAVSVIHTTSSSEIHESSLENLTKPSSPSDFSSVKNCHNPESELPSEMLYSSSVSRVSFHDDSLDVSPNAKQLDGECVRDDLEENSRLSLQDDNSDCKNLRNDNINKDLALGSGDDDSPLIFIETSQKLDAGTLGIDDNPLDDTNTELRAEDEDSHPDSCIVVVEDDESKEDEDNSNICVTTEGDSVLESPVLKDTDISQRSYLKEDKVPSEGASELNESDNDEHCVLTSNTKLPFHKAYNYEPEVTTPISPPVSQNDKVGNKTISEYDFEPDIDESKVDSAKLEESSKNEPLDIENMDSDLIIAESADDEECNSDVMDTNFVKNEAKDFTFRSDLECASTRDVDVSEKSKDIISASSTSKDLIDGVLPFSNNTTDVKEDNNESSLVNTVTTNLQSNIVQDNEDFSNNEETLVKPPKKTYIRKKVRKNIIESKSNVKEKIELFSVEDFNFSECDKDIKDIESALNYEQQKESPLSSKDSAEEDDRLLLSDVQSKVSATYNRKKKSVIYNKKKTVPTKQGLQPRSLRPRSLPSRLPFENGTPEVSNSNSKKSSFDSNSSENIPWGDVLLKTSFQPCSVASDVPSTSVAPQSTSSQKETATPILSPEQRRRKLKYKRAFDRLLNSSPIGTKRPKVTSKQIPRRRKKSISASQSDTFPSTSSSEFQKRKSHPMHGIRSFKSPAERKIQTKESTKEGTIQYLSNLQSTSNQPVQIEPDTLHDTYSCSSCNFSTVFVDNLIEHLKYCSSRQPLLSYSVNDMDKRQRIRGEDFKEPHTTEEVAVVITNTMRKLRKTLERDDSPMRFNSDADEDLDFLRKRAQYGYSEDDVVWVKFKDRFWPALIIHLEKSIKEKSRNKRPSKKRKRNNNKVCGIKGLNAYVRLIKYPGEAKGLKVKHGNIRTFDDYKWNVLCLKEAENLPNNKEFVIAVQSSEAFMRRKFLGIQEEPGRQFFHVDDEVDFVTDSASSDSIVNEDSDSEDEAMQWKLMESSAQTTRQARYEKLDTEKILDFILDGQADDYVLEIFFEKKHSNRHKIFFESKGPLAPNLNHRAWFGPCVKTSQQERVYNHFLKLFNSKIGNDYAYISSYLVQVMIPEAMVKAISVIENISEKDAECLLESEDNLDTEHDDANIVDSLDAEHEDHIIVDRDS